MGAGVPDKDGGARTEDGGRTEVGRRFAPADASCEDTIGAADAGDESPAVDVRHR